MLFERINYSSDISYLNNIIIREYDISKANISILYSKGIINKDTYDYLYNSERMVRQTYIGKLERDDKNVLKALQNGIIEAKKMLFEANYIKDHEVLSIKNDAVFTINKNLSVTDFGLIKFALKNIYTSYYKIKNLEFYYYFNSMTKYENISVKGINDDALNNLHKDFMLDFFKDIFYTLQMIGPSAALDMLKTFYMQYISLALPAGYYREFNPNSMYHFHNFTYIGAGFMAENISEKDKIALDITYNLSLLLELQKIILSMIFK